MGDTRDIDRRGNIAGIRCVMDNAINYVLQVFEKKYYDQNPDIAIEGEHCTKDELLACNCITGIMLNYAGYLLSICLKINACTLEFQLNQHIGYIQVNYGTQALIPDCIQGNAFSGFYLGKWICAKSGRTSNQSYIPFRSYPDREYLTKKLKDSAVMQEVYRKNGDIYYCYYLKFWIDFLAAMRMQKLETSSRAFLAMAVFMFPGRTMKCIKVCICSTTGHNIQELKKMAEFLNAYLCFLDNLQNNKTELVFFQEFVQGFKALTNVYTGYFIEKIIWDKKTPNAKENLYRILMSAYERNCAERKRFRSDLNLCIRKLKEDKIWPGEKLE